MSYIFFALTAAFSFALATLISKLASKHTLKSWDQLWVFFLLTFSPYPLLTAPFFGPIVWPTETVLYIFLNSFFFLLGLAFFFKAMLVIDASVMAPLFQLQAAAIAILAFFFLGERFLPLTYLWIGLIIFGAMLSSLDEKFSLRSFLQPGIALAVLANISFAVSNLFVGISMRTLTFYNVMFWTPVINFIFIAIFIFWRRPNLRVKFKQTVPLFAAGLFQFFGNLSILLSFRTNLSVSSALAMLSSPIIFIISIFASKLYPKLLEHHSAKVYALRGLGLAIILFSALNLTLAQ